MNISQVASQIGESPTLKLNEKAATLRARGEPVIHLGSGEPKTKTPFEALLAAAGKLATADIKYTPTDGIPELKKAIVRYTEDNYGRRVATENIIVSPGAKAALFNLFVTILDPDDEVIILAPYWVSYPDMVRMCRARPVVVPPQPGTFEPSIAAIEAAMGPKTKAVVVNSPNNPSGEVYSEGFVADVVRLCERRGVFLVMDDIYHKLVFDGRVAPSCYRYATDLSEDSRLVVINGVSKLYAMTGFRIGWAVAPARVIAAMTNVQAQSVSCPSALLQVAAASALNGSQASVESLRLTLQNHRDILLRELATLERVKVRKPMGTFYCFADFSQYCKDSGALSAFLLEKALVVTVPGKEFGMDGHLRISFCGAASEIVEGVARIRWALDPSAPKELYIGDRRVERTFVAPH